MDNIKIEKLKTSHIEKILEIEKLCFSDPWSKTMLEDELKNPLSYYIVLIKDDDIIGYADFWDIVGDAQIMNVAISKKYQGKGYSNILMNKMIEEAIKRNLDTMSLEVRVSNEKAINLYEKYDFEIQGKRKNYYQDNKEDAYIMWKFFV